MVPDVNGIIGLHLRQADVGVGGGEGHSVVNGLLYVGLGKLGAHLKHSTLQITREALLKGEAKYC